ncbi:MAG: hypothetical protein JNL34_14130 [Anaerolineae bacterium]|nr:hypothetical protein [Anaerolineae bacterium]
MISPATVQSDAPPVRPAIRAHDVVLLSGREWAWLVTVSCVLVIISLIPLFAAAGAMAGSQWQFMGFTHNYLDGASYLSKMRIGFEGGWLLQFLHTPEAHEGALMMVLYPALGHLARITGLDLIVVFHLARVVGAFIMYLSLYTLGAVLWAGVQARRLFFLIAALGFGFGWLLAPLTGLTTFPDLTIPEVFPFYSSLVNPHFPLAIAALALLTAQFVLLVRSGGSALPRGSWLGTAVLSLALALLYPQGLAPFAAAAVLYLALVAWKERKLPHQALALVAALIVPAIPVAVYIGLEVRFSDVLTEWNRQNVTAAPPLWVLLAGLGLPLLLGLPAMWRAARRTDRDGDRLMLIWLLCMLVFMYLPTNIQRRFSVGMMIPVAFFAVRAVRDFWMIKLGERGGRLLVAVSLVVMSLSGLFIALAVPAPLLAGDGEARIGVVLPSEYGGALEWLAQRATREDVVLAAEETGAWIPGWTGARVVYGHPFETLDAEAKLAAVEGWYGLTGSTDCAALLSEFGVRYVVFGPLEARYGAGACVSGLEPMMRSGAVSVYAVPQF